MTPISTTKARLWDYFMLAVRLLLAFTCISYGYGKLVGGQSGITGVVPVDS